MRQSEGDPRATVIRNVTFDQELIEQTLHQIPALEDLTVQRLIQLYEKCPDIREEHQYVEGIFHKRKVFSEMVCWIMSPEKLLSKEQISNKHEFHKSGTLRNAQICSRILKDNPSFYEQLYLKAYSDESYLFQWFECLSKSQASSIDTALGYFAEILIPFVKYDFSNSSRVWDELDATLTCEFAEQSSSKKMPLNDSQSYKEFLESSEQQKSRKLEESITILRLFSDNFFETIFRYVRHQSVFKLVHNLVLASLEENDLNRSKFIFRRFLECSTSTGLEGDCFSLEKIELPALDVCSEYIVEVLNEILSNVHTDKNYRVIFFMDAILRVKLIPVYLERVKESLLMKNNDDQMTASMDYSAIIEEEEAVERILKSLCLLVQIFLKMNKKVRKSSEDLERESKYYTEETEDPTSCEEDVMQFFGTQIEGIFEELPVLSNLVKKNQSRSVAFSSGQNIKPVTMCKYEYFQLIFYCLVLSRELPEEFVLDTERINLFWMVEKYLNENRWNNIAQRVLEKIANLLIVNNDNFFRTKEMSKNNMADEFLNSVIESFTNRSYIFLNSFRFTNQGNIHTLYLVARTIINELKNSQKLANFIHHFDHYKKFVINDLQHYETKTFELQHRPQEEDLRTSERKSSDEALRLEVDEVSIQEIVKKIETVNKWPIKDKKSSSVIMNRANSYMSDGFKRVSIPIRQESAALKFPLSEEKIFLGALGPGIRQNRAHSNFISAQRDSSANNSSRLESNLDLASKGSSIFPEIEESHLEDQMDRASELLQYTGKNAPEIHIATIRSKANKSDHFKDSKDFGTPSSKGSKKERNSSERSEL